MSSSLHLQPPKKNFFVSYTKTDRNWAEWIAWYLENEGYTCILQKWDFRSGGNFVLDMQEATQAERTIAVLSPDYLSAPFPQAEWAAAFVQDPTSKDRKLIPVRVLDCKPAGLLASIGYIDLVGLDEQTALAKLLQSIKGERAKPTSAPGFPGSAPSSASTHPATGTSTPPPFPTPASKNPLASKPVETFIIYAPQDESYLVDLEKHLQPLKDTGQLHIWHQGKLKAGSEIQVETDKNFYKAKLFLLLVSADFLSSRNCQMLTEQAMRRHKSKEVEVIPIILSPCLWEHSSFNALTILPKKGSKSSAEPKSVDEWSNKKSAYLNIIKGIQEMLHP